MSRNQRTRTLWGFKSALRQNVKLKVNIFEQFVLDVDKVHLKGSPVRSPSTCRKAVFCS